MTEKSFCSALTMQYNENYILPNAAAYLYISEQSFD